MGSQAKTETEAKRTARGRGGFCWDGSVRSTTGCQGVQGAAWDGHGCSGPLGSGDRPPAGEWAAHEG